MSPSGSSDSERRDSKRYNLTWPLRLLLPDRKILSLRTRDVSLGGIGFNCLQQLPVGLKISAELTPYYYGRHYIIRARGEITYNAIFAGNQGYGHGMRFTLLPEQQRQQLDELLKSLRQ